MSDVDLFALAEAALGASAVAPNDLAATYYMATARVALAKLYEELRAFELLLAAREETLVRRIGPAQQLPLDGETK